MFLSPLGTCCCFGLFEWLGWKEEVREKEKDGRRSDQRVGDEFCAGDREWKVSSALTWCVVLVYDYLSRQQDPQQRLQHHCQE